MNFIPHQYFNSKEKIPIVIVDGVIGAGKTTLVQALENDEELKETGLLSSYEDVEQFSYLLEMFYRNRDRYLFLLQLQIFICSCASLMSLYQREEERCSSPSRTGVSPQFILCDRSFESCDIFSRVNLLSSDRYSLLQLLKRHSFFSDDLPVFSFGECILHVYLRCSLETCKERIKKRDRKGEEAIDLEYLERLDKEHEVYFSKFVGKQKEKLMIIDTTEMKEEEIKEKVKERIMKELEERKKEEIEESSQ